MNRKSIIIYIVLFLLGFRVINAQKTISVSGGEATGTGGIVSYSTGQIVYSTNLGSNGSVSQGVQQAFEISTVLGIEDNIRNLLFTAYPNPSKGKLTLHINSFGKNDTEYALFNVQGQLLSRKNILKEYTNISMEKLAKSIYFLKIISKNKIVKIFKIINK